MSIANVSLRSGSMPPFLGLSTDVVRDPRRVPCGHRPPIARGAHSARFRWHAKLVLVCLIAACGVIGAGPARGEPLRIDNPAASGEKKYPEIEEARKKLAQQDVDGALRGAQCRCQGPPGPAQWPRADGPGVFRDESARTRRGIQLEKAVMENPDDADAYLTMADVALREGQWTVAGLLSDKALSIAQAFKGDADKKKDLLKRAYTGEAYAARRSANSGRKPARCSRPY